MVTHSCRVWLYIRNCEYVSYYLQLENVETLYVRQKLTVSETDFNRMTKMPALNMRFCVMAGVTSMKIKFKQPIN